MPPIDVTTASARLGAGLVRPKSNCSDRRRPMRGDRAEATRTPPSSAQVAAGSQDALATLYDRHAESVYVAACRLTSDRQVAEEVVQETFLALWNRAELFDPGTRLARRHGCTPSPGIGPSTACAPSGDARGSYRSRRSARTRSRCVGARADRRRWLGRRWRRPGPRPGRRARQPRDHGSRSGSRSTACPKPNGP